jgi:hypothetical protein
MGLDGQHEQKEDLLKEAHNLPA